MRLIDADALFSDFENARWYDNNDRDLVAEDILMDAPTIEPPVARGEWVKKETGSETLAICNQCKYPVSWWHKSNYCPSCGAKMEEME